MTVWTVNWLLIDKSSDRLNETEIQLDLANVECEALRQEVRVSSAIVHKIGNRCSDYECKHAKCHLKWKLCETPFVKDRVCRIFSFFIKRAIKLRTSNWTHTAGQSGRKNSTDDAVVVVLSDWKNKLNFDCHLLREITSKITTTKQPQKVIPTGTAPPKLICYL